MLLTLTAVAPLAGCDPAEAGTPSHGVTDRLTVADPVAPTIKVYSAGGHLVDKGKLQDGSGPPEPWYWYSLPFLLLDVEVTGEQISVYDGDGNGIATSPSSPVFFTDDQGRELILIVEF